MRTRAQVNAWNDLTAQHRRAAAAFVAEVAAARRAHASPPHAARPRASNAPSLAANSALEATQSTTAFVTPEKKTRKRKLSSTATPTGAVATRRSTTSPPPVASLPHAVAPEPTDISPAVRDAKRRAMPAPTPAKPAKATLIRRTLDYAEADAAPPTPELTARDVLQRVASGDRDDAAACGMVVGRAEERLQIERVFESSPRVRDATRALFVIGPPGTGKSSCVAHVASHYAATTTVVRLNCSTFATPAALLDAVREQLSRHQVTRRALPALDDARELDAFLAETLHAAATRDCVLVLDEVDHLVRLPSATLKRQAQRLLAFLVRWAHAPNATLRVVGILNGVDMHAQIAAFLAHDAAPAVRAVLFPAYALDELVAILEATVRAAMGNNSTTTSSLEDVVEPRALELIARKVAARDGDARRAVGLLRQCARVCLAASTSDSQSVRIGVRDVLKCTSAAIATQLTVAKQIQQLPRAPKVLLYAVTRLAACETAAVTLQDVLDELEALRDTQPSLAWLPRFRLEELQQHLGALACYALVKQTPAKSKSAWHAKLASTVAMDALVRAFQDDELLMQLPTSTK